MAVREQGHMALDRADLCDHTIDARPDLLRAFPTRASIGEHYPPRPCGVDLLWGESLVLAVVPFHQIAIDLGSLAESRQLTSFPRPLERARQDERKGLLG